MFSRAGVTGVPGILQTGSSEPIGYAMHVNNTSTHQHWPYLKNRQKFTLKNIQEVRDFFHSSNGFHDGLSFMHPWKGTALIAQNNLSSAHNWSRAQLSEKWFRRTGVSWRSGEPQQCGSSINSLVPTINDYDTWWWWCTLWRIINEIVNEECLHCPKICLWWHFHKS